MYIYIHIYIYIYITHVCLTITRRGAGMVGAVRTGVMFIAVRAAACIVNDYTSTYIYIYIYMYIHIQYAFSSFCLCGPRRSEGRRKSAGIGRTAKISHEVEYGRPMIDYYDDDYYYYAARRVSDATPKHFEGYHL